MGQVLKDSELNEQAGENVECANICRVYLLLLYKQGINFVIIINSFIISNIIIIG